MNPVGDVNTIAADIGTETLKIGYCGALHPTIFNSTRQNPNYESPVLHSVISSPSYYLSLLTSSLSCNDPLVLAVNYEEKMVVKKNIVGYLLDKKYTNGILLVPSNLMDMYSHGKSSGIVVNMSGGSTSVSTIIEGNVTHYYSVPIGGFDLTQKFRKYLNEEDLVPRGYKSNEKGDNDAKFAFLKDELCREIKESVIEVKSERNSETFYELPSGKSIKFGNERYELADYLLEKSNLIETVRSLIDKNDQDVRHILVNNIMLCGMGVINGISERLVSELSKTYSPSKIRIYWEKKVFSTFFGASVVGSVGMAKNMFITQADYEECGESILERKNVMW
ncbi:actin-like protein [Hamiltosporidium tvaerminnensis]|uniref:Actin-like protein n=2 Tax=Hamiltosporidium TaxID=1176354 RepID=A0A4Q9KWQ1_9MICR|nr:hypothetical protein LUQ84_001289 [Hamiltosporidium tvaerminnensis]TBT99326.1 actin-like protein [Hamiltosporidium magnivora]TBU04104.1 actin-like protein [Hamiltosporidium tvaerminnensis]